MPKRKSSGLARLIMNSPIPLLPADDPIFSAGWIVGQTFAGASPLDAAERRSRKKVQRKKK